MDRPVNINRLRREAKSMRIKASRIKKDGEFDVPAWITAYAKLFDSSADELQFMRNLIVDMGRSHVCSGRISKESCTRCGAETIAEGLRSGKPE